MRGFTLLEILVVIGIILILVTLAVPALHGFQLKSDLDNSAEELINNLRLAQNKTLASEGASSWGIYFSTGTSPHQYILFKGENYTSRDISADETHKLPKTVIISEINLMDGEEVVFERVTGFARQAGTIKLTSEADSSNSKTIYIENSGLAGLTVPLTPSDENRIKDSRHLHIDYKNRTIATSTEDIVLTFEGGVTETVIIADNLKDGQIYWEGEVEVGGEIQKLKIHTHRLNDALLGTQFCIHRDRRYNTKSLTITISGDLSGSLIEYSADGLTTIYTSIYVTNLQWQ